MRRFKFSPIAITIFIRILMKKSSTIYKKLSCFCCEFIHQSVKLTQSTRVYIENEDNNLILFGCHLCCLGICVSYFPFYFSTRNKLEFVISHQKCAILDNTNRNFQTIKSFISLNMQTA